MSKPTAAETDALFAAYEQSEHFKLSEAKFKALQQTHKREPLPTEICAHCHKPLGKNGVIAIDTPYHRACYMSGFRD